MLTALADKASDEVPKDTANRWTLYAQSLQKYRNDLVSRNSASKLKLEQMEKEDARKITSEGLRDGFNATHVAKADSSLTSSRKRSKS